MSHSCEDRSSCCSPDRSSRVFALYLPSATPSSADRRVFPKAKPCLCQSLRRRIQPTQCHDPFGTRGTGGTRSCLIITTTTPVCKECPYMRERPGAPVGQKTPAVRSVRTLSSPGDRDNVSVHLGPRRARPVAPAASIQRDRETARRMASLDTPEPIHVPCDRKPVVYFGAVDMSIDDPVLSCPAQVQFN